MNLHAQAGGLSVRAQASALSSRGRRGWAAGRRVLDVHYIAVIGIVSLLLYLVTWPTNRAEAEDGFMYAHYAETGGQGLNARHLLYGPIVRGVYVVVSAITPTIRAHQILAAVSLLSAVLTLCLIGWVIRVMLARSLAVTLAATALLGASYGFWRYATEAEIYALANLLAVATFVVAFRWHRQEALIGAAVVGAVTVLIHAGTVVGVLAAIPVGLARRVGLRLAAAYVAITSAIIVVVGGLALLVTGSRLDALAESAPYSGPLTYVASVFGAAATVAAGNFVFAYDSINQRLTDVLSANSFADMLYMGQHASTMVRVGSVLTILVLLGLVVHATIAWARGGDGEVDVVPRDLSSAVVVWLLGLAIVGVLGSGGNVEGWLFALPPAAIALALWPLPVIYRNSRSVLVLLPLALLLHNFVGGMLMLQSSDGDYYKASTAWLLTAAGPDDVIVLAGEYDFDGYVLYHGASTVIPAHLYTAEELESIVREADGDVFLTAEVVEPTPSTFGIGPENRGEIERFVDTVSSDLAIVHRATPGGPVYVVR